MLTHLLFRSWRPHRARGNSKGKAHRKQAFEQKEIAIGSPAYTFMHESLDENEERRVPILINQDQAKEGCSTGMIFAHVVPQDGPPYAVKTSAGAIGQLGHRELYLSGRKPRVFSNSTPEVPFRPLEGLSRRSEEV